MPEITFKYIIRSILFFSYLFVLILALSFLGCTNFTSKNNDLEKDSLDLIKAGRFVGYSDSLGSSIDTINPYVKDNLITVNYTIASQKDSKFPWIDIECYTLDSVSWDKLENLNITYKSKLPLSITLTQNILLDNGESYRYILPASNDWKTTEIKVSQFKQPDWSTHKNILLDLQNIRSIGVIPVIENNNKAFKNSFMIKKFTAHGVIINKPLVQQDKQIIFQSINNNKIFFDVNEKGVYQFKISDTLGNIIECFSDSIQQTGLNNTPLKKPLQSGVYNIKISNTKNSICIKRAVSNLPTYFTSKKF